MLLPLTFSCFSKIQTSFTFLVPAHPGSSGQRADLEWLYYLGHSKNSYCVIDWLQEGAKNSVWNWARGKEKHYSETDVTGGGWWGNVYIPIPVPPLCIRRVGTTICMFVRGARVRCVFAIQCWQPCQRGVIVIRYILLICVHARLYLCDQRRKYVVQRLNWLGRLGWRLHDVAD